MALQYYAEHLNGDPRNRCYLVVMQISLMTNLQPKQVHQKILTLTLMPG